MSSPEPVLTTADAVEAVRRVLASKRRAPVVVDPDDRFEDLKFDSLDTAELFVTLEEIAGLDLDPESADGVERVGDLVRLRRL